MKNINISVKTAFLLLSSLFYLLSSAPVSASTTLYLGPIEKTYDENGAVVEEKVYYSAGWATGVRDQGSGISYLFSDHLGSTVLVTDNSGNSVSNSVYYPFGNEVNQESLQLRSGQAGIRNYGIDNPSASSGRSSTDRLYTGQRLDSSTSLYFYNARYYNPTIGHFISADKAPSFARLSRASAGEANRYAYVGNNPIMRNDPTGLQEGPIDLLNKGINLFNQCQNDPNCKTLINEAVSTAQSLIFQNSSNQQKQPPVAQKIAQTTKISNKPGYLPMFIQNNYEIYANIRGARSADSSLWENLKYVINPELVHYDIDTVYLGTKKVYYGLGNQTLQAQPDAGKKEAPVNSAKKAYQVKDKMYGFPFTSYNAFILDAQTESSCSAAGGSLRTSSSVCAEEIKIGTKTVPPFLLQIINSEDQLMKECLSYSSPQECVVEASKSILPVIQVDIETAKKLKNQ